MNPRLKLALVSFVAGAAMALNTTGAKALPFPSLFASAWAVGGKVGAPGATAFGVPLQLQRGVESYQRLDDAMPKRNRWGDYSSTTRGPVPAQGFWTIQEWASGIDIWSTQITGLTIKPNLGLNKARNFTGSNYNVSGFIPPDTDGAIGPDHFVELINGAYAVYKKNGLLAQPRKTLDEFWIAAGIPANQIAGFTFDPRVLFDAASHRWFAVSVDKGAGNSFYVAVSKDSNPLHGWKGFKFAANPANPLLFADFPTLGLNADGVYISSNNIPGGSDTIAVLPKADLIAGSIANRTLFQGVSAANFGVTVQPVVDLLNQGLPEATVASRFFSPSSPFVRNNINGPINNPSTDAAGTTINATVYQTPPDARQPGIKQDLNTFHNGIGSSAIRLGNDIWAVQNVEDPQFKHSAIRWVRINAANNQVIQEGLINDPVFDFYYGSISVKDNGDILIGFSGSGREFDYGDAPDSYRTTLARRGPRYDVGELQRLGGRWDFDPNGQPTACACGDDVSILGAIDPRFPVADDEDGVAFGKDFVTVTFNISRSGVNPYELRAWWDLNRDGCFEHLTADDCNAGSELFIDDTEFLGPGIYRIQYPLGFDPRLYYSRFRLTWDPEEPDVWPYEYFVSGPDRVAQGEVEDYIAGVPEPGETALLLFGTVNFSILLSLRRLRSRVRTH